VIARDSLSCLSAFKGFDEGILKISFDDDGMRQAFEWCEGQNPLNEEFIERVQENFSSKEIAQSLLAIYESTLKGSN
jgi:hypothetical protein